MTATVRVGGLRGFGQLVTSLGGDPASLTQDCGIDPAILSDEDALGLSVTANNPYSLAVAGVGLGSHLGSIAPRWSGPQGVITRQRPMAVSKISSSGERPQR